ncbi:MAG TPA: CarD family transcriptional regulator [Anaeromyxobacteraceae bacterium]|nr:CarD family transcriptional regulator [Anaeromyxobacteraceae bacterium]
MKGPPPPARYEEPKEQLPAIEGIIIDAGALEPGDRVVYPNQGVCRITGTESKEIAGQALELVRMVREEDGAAVLVPKGKVPTIGLRKVASGDQIEGVFHYLAAQYDDPELDWKIRHRDNADRLIAGGVLGVAEVVKGLHALSRIRPLPTKEREQYDNARHLLVHEVAVSLSVPPAMAEDYVDYALMPPAGVTFKLKPPPKPVELPSRPRRKVVARTSEDDLELDELGLDLDLPEVPGAGTETPDLPEAPEEIAVSADDSPPALVDDSPPALEEGDSGEAGAEEAAGEPEPEPALDDGESEELAPRRRKATSGEHPEKAPRATTSASSTAKKKRPAKKPSKPSKSAHRTHEAKGKSEKKKPVKAPPKKPGSKAGKKK